MNTTLTIEFIGPHAGHLYSTMCNMVNAALAQTQVPATEYDRRYSTTGDHIIFGFVPKPEPPSPPAWHPPFEHGWTHYWRPHVTAGLSGWARCRSGQLFSWHVPRGDLPQEGQWSFAGTYSEPYGEGWKQVFPTVQGGTP